MHPYLEIAKLHSDNQADRTARSALPDAPVQPYRRRRPVGHRVRNALRRRTP
jgi:hypothetical protein